MRWLWIFLTISLKVKQIMEMEMKIFLSRLPNLLVVYCNFEILRAINTVLGYMYYNVLHIMNQRSNKVMICYNYQKI